MDYVYRSFIERGFAHDDIFYLRESLGTALPSDIVVDWQSPSKSKFLETINVWATDKMIAQPGPLYLVMIDHGLEDRFFSFSGSFVEADRVLTPGDLDNALNTLDADLAAEPVVNEGVVIINGFCHSGSFIDLVSAPNRIVISSSKRDEISHRGALDPVDGVRDGELFITELFRGLRGGKNFKTAFEEASQRIADFTLSRSNAADGSADLPQEPLLDDNGDGFGTVGPDLSFEAGLDGVRAAGIHLGLSFNSLGDSAGWFTASQTVTLGPLEAVPTFFAEATESGPTGNFA